MTVRKLTSYNRRKLRANRGSSIGVLWIVWKRSENSFSPQILNKILPKTFLNSISVGKYGNQLFGYFAARTVDIFEPISKQRQINHFIGFLHLRLSVDVGIRQDKEWLRSTYHSPEKLSSNDCVGWMHQCEKLIKFPSHNITMDILHTPFDRFCVIGAKSNILVLTTQYVFNVLPEVIYITKDLRSRFIEHMGCLSLSCMSDHFVPLHLPDEDKYCPAPNNSCNPSAKRTGPLEYTLLVPSSRSDEYSTDKRQHCQGINQNSSVLAIYLHDSAYSTARLQKGLRA